jgi:hypothetical protein
MIQQSGYFDLSGMNISMGRALTQFALSGIGGGAVLAAGTAAVPVIAPAFRGAALGAAMDLSSSIITGVTEVSEAAEAAVQSIEQLGAELRAIELGNPEVAGPELPWGP